MTIQVVCSLMLVQSADCCQNLGSCTSCSLCEEPLCLCGGSPPCSKCLLSAKAQRRLRWPGLCLHWCEQCFRLFSEAGNVGAYIMCNSASCSWLGQQTQGCALQWEGISPYQNAGELAFWNGMGSI